MSTQAAAATPTDKPKLSTVLASPKMLAILVLGAASGFPNQITESVLQAWLKDSGATNTTIGVLSYVAIPYLLKFLWAPLLDRYPLPLLGRRRGWILVTQLALAATIAMYAVQNPAVSLAPVAVCAVMIVFFSATQDIAFDAYRTDVALPSERGLAAAANNLGYRTSAWLASAFALVVADFFGWRLALLILAGVMAAFCLATIYAPEPEYRHQPPRTLKESIVEPLEELLGSPSAIAFIALILLFKVGDAFALRLFTPFMMDIGFTKTEIALVLKALFTASAVIGAVLGGIWMVKLGLLRSMLIFGVLQAAVESSLLRSRAHRQELSRHDRRRHHRQCGRRHGQHCERRADHGAVRRSLQRISIRAVIGDRTDAALSVGWTGRLARRYRRLGHVLCSEFCDGASRPRARVVHASQGR